MNQSIVFISYSWKDKKFADRICNTLESKKIKYNRDVKDVKYKDSIKDFMKKVRSSDYVVMLISDNFLKSANCMFEVMEFIKDDDFNKRLLQVILPTARIYKGDRINYIKYWGEEFRKLHEITKDIPSHQIIDTSTYIKHVNNIASNIDEFIGVLVSENSISFENLKNNNFKEITDFIDNSLSTQPLMNEELEVSILGSTEDFLRKDTPIIFSPLGIVIYFDIENKSDYNIFFFIKFKVNKLQFSEASDETNHKIFDLKNIGSFIEIKSDKYILSSKSTERININLHFSADYNYDQNDLLNMECTIFSEHASISRNLNCNLIYNP